MSRSETGPNPLSRPGGSSLPRGPAPNGFVTAETAVVLPVLVLLTALLITGIAAGAAQIRCVDAAAAGARALARGEPADIAHARALAAAPAGARGEADTRDGLIRFRVSAEVGPPGTMWAGVGFHVEHVAVAAVEELPPEALPDAPGAQDTRDTREARETRGTQDTQDTPRAQDTRGTPEARGTRGTPRAQGIQDTQDAPEVQGTPHRPRVDDASAPP